MESSVDTDRAVLKRLFAATHGCYPAAVTLSKPQFSVADLTVRRDGELCVLEANKGGASVTVHLPPEELRAFVENVRAFLDAPAPRVDSQERRCVGTWI